MGNTVEAGRGKPQVVRAARRNRPRTGDFSGRPGLPPSVLNNDDVRGALVMVVDDDPAWRTILQLELSMRGYRLLMAEDGQQALKQLSHSEQPEAAVFDVMLPGSIDGPDLARWMHPDYRDIPVILFTAYPENQSGVDWPAGVVGRLSKSDPISDLHELLARTIRAARLMRTA